MDLINPLNIILLGIVIALLVLLSCVWPPDSPWSPWWRTNGKKSISAARLADIKSKDIVYELGSGDATFLVTIAKKYGAKCIGIEIDPVRHIIAGLNVKLNGVSNKVTLEKKSFYDVNLKNATVVYAYLVPRVLEKLKPQLFKQLKKGTKVVSHVYKFTPDKKLKYIKTDKKSRMHLYEIT